MIATLESLLFSPRRPVGAVALAALIAAGALAAALLVAAAGPLLALAAVLGAIGAMLVLSDMRWGFVALLGVVALLPFAALPVKVVFTPSFLDVALVALFFVWLMRVVTRRQSAVSAPRMGAIVVLFLAVVLFAFANSLRFGMPGFTTIRNVAELGLAILTYFLVVAWARDTSDLCFLARVIMVAGAGAAAIAVLFYVLPPASTVRILDALGRFNYPGGYGALRYIEDSADNPMRAIGTMVDPNVLGGFMVLIAALTAPQLVSAAPLFRRRWIALFMAVEALALYLTYSRGSLLGLATALAVMGLLRYRKLLWIGLGALILLLLLPPAQTYVAHLVEGIQLQDRATLMRLGEYRDALGLIARYPWFGVGFSGSPEADLYVGVSNLYLLMAEEMGVLGVLVFLVAVMVFFAQLWQAWRWLRHGSAPEPQLEALLLGVGAAVAGALVGGIFDHYLFNLVYPHMAVLFWVYLGLGTRAAQLALETKTALVVGAQFVPN